MPRTLATYSDTDLLTMCAARTDTALLAFSELYERHHGLALALARRTIADPQQAEDVVETAFLTLWQRAQRYEPTHFTVQEWLLGLVRHHARQLASNPVGAPLLAFPGVVLASGALDDLTGLVAGD